MPRLLLSLVVMVIAGIALPSNAFAEEAAEKPPLHVYLLIGQSNMAGRATIPDDAKGVIDRCFLLDREGNWIPAQNPLNLHSTIRKGEGMQQLGPGYSFVKTLLAEDEDVRIGLVVNAKGGSRIEQWARGTGFFNQAVKRMKQATDARGELKGMIWHQGESNAGKPDGYAEKLAELVTDLRAALDAEDVPFVAGQVLRRPKWEVINPEIDQLPTLVPLTAVASSEGLTAKDAVHFDTAGQLELGKRFAKALLSLTQIEAEPTE